MSKLLVSLAGEDILKIKNKMGMKASELCTDQRLKRELDSSINDISTN
jgi:hypothetical protein